jgi:hypothetical protein
LQLSVFAHDLVAVEAEPDIPPMILKMKPTHLILLAPHYRPLQLQLIDY